MKTLLIVSGGDSPGINAVLYEYTRLAARNHDPVVGASGGFAGALDGRLKVFTPSDFAPVMALGGSWLPSSRDAVLKNPENRQRLADILESQQIDNIVLLGGDGTLRNIPPILRDLGIACIGIPTTIDNDVPGSEQTIGFDTACNFAHQTIDGLLMTARALPGRVFSVETLGGNTGMIALDVAHAAGAHAILIPEYAYDSGWLVSRVETALKASDFALIVLSEGITGARTLPEDFQNLSGRKVRDTRLGHGQRGAAPTHRDRRLAFDMAHAAYNALCSGVTFGTVVADQTGQISIENRPIRDLSVRLPDRALYNRINGLE